MSVQTQSPVLLAGEYFVTGQGYGQGVDYYLTVVGPDGRATDQKVYWTWSKTAHQVAEEAVAQHLGDHVAVARTAPTRGYSGEFVVTMG